MWEANQSVLRFHLRVFLFKSSLTQEAHSMSLTKKYGRNLANNSCTLSFNQTLLSSKDLPEKLKNLGKVKLNMTIGPVVHRLDFLVVRQTRVLLLLGVPALKKFELVLDFRHLRQWSLTHLSVHSKFHHAKSS